MRIAMMGTGPFAVPTLRALVGSSHQVVAVVTRPAAATRGNRRPPPNPMRAAATELNLPILEPLSINTDEACAELRALEAELFVVCDYGQILKGHVLEIARYGGINLHGSLLPKYRGAAPVAWAIYHGESMTGNTVIQMTPGLDAGPILGQCRTPIESDDTAATLEERLAEMGAPVVVEVVDALAAGTTAPVMQDASQATKAPRLKKEDGLIDWSRSARAIERQIRAFQPWPRSYCFVAAAKDDPLRLVIQRATALSDTTDAAPGTILIAHKQLGIATGDGILQLDEIQPAGKRAMSAEEFLRGHALAVGEVLE
ncbi:MAG: methionyl-tRNA formyltransferase [Planctomycetales bacterium]|nr:methionyl-tRNA formyltransferase [Planctomycetales bacterium]